MLKFTRNINEETFDKEISTSQHLVMVDFWADWCNPCKSLSPIIDDLAEEYIGELKVCKINADENKKIMDRYAVRGLPTMIFFKNGKECDRIIGVVTKSRIAELIEAQL